MKIYSHYFLSIFLFLASSVTSFSQDKVSFRVNEKLFVKGNSILIGNTILGKHQTKPFNDIKVPNDAVDMKYVDIDGDESTFSSSSAQIVLPATAQRIVYAGLYWSGLYPAEKSVMRRGNRRMIYKRKGDRVANVNGIRIKTSEQTYLDIEGEIVFDAENKGALKRDSPYVCRADITEYLKENSFEKTVFTAANIRAVNGKLEGGSAAGWLLYIIYEDVTETPKYFTTYDGFEQVIKKSMNITFDDFQVKTQGDIVSTLVMASLEGDDKIKGDQCAIYNSETGRYTLLETNEREASNFFTSSITTRNKTKSERTPSSKNTLGFDLIKMELPKGIIKNNAANAKIQFKTRKDRFYLFFTAFETEIEESYLIERNKSSTKKLDNIISERIEAKPMDSVQKIIAETTNDVPAKIEIVEKINRVDDIVNLSIEGMASGYYLVTNVFSLERGVNKWTNDLLAKGYNPQGFVNPENGWTYVYVERGNILAEIFNKKEALRKLSLFENAWVIGINR